MTWQWTVRSSAFPVADGAEPLPADSLEWLTSDEPASPSPSQDGAGPVAEPENPVFGSPENPKPQPLRRYCLCGATAYARSTPAQPAEDVIRMWEGLHQKPGCGPASRQQAQTARRRAARVLAREGEGR